MAPNPPGTTPAEATLGLSGCPTIENQQNEITPPPVKIIIR